MPSNDDAVVVPVLVVLVRYSSDEPPLPPRWDDLPVQQQRRLVSDVGVVG